MFGSAGVPTRPAGYTGDGCHQLVALRDAMATYEAGVAQGSGSMAFPKKGAGTPSSPLASLVRRTRSDELGIQVYMLLNNWGQFYPPKPTERASSL
jgi:hypothetical protein